jgi:DNA polymerase elongation subunit (family B)
VVAKALEEAGVKLAAGEMVEYVIVDATGKKKPEKAKPLALYAFEDGYDVDKYTEMALKAVETLLLPFGYSYDTLQEIFAPKPAKKEAAVRRRIPRSLPLFPDEHAGQQDSA